jgi:hypothetical protein
LSNPNKNGAKIATHTIGKVSSRSYTRCAPLAAFYNSSQEDIIAYIEKYKLIIKNDETYKNLEQAVIIKMFSLLLNSEGYYYTSLIASLEAYNSKPASEIKSFLYVADIVLKHCSSYYKVFIEEKIGLKTDLIGVDALIYTLTTMLEKFDNKDMIGGYFYDFNTKDNVVKRIDNIVTVYNYLKLDNKINKAPVENIMKNKI